MNNYVNKMNKNKQQKADYISKNNLKTIKNTIYLLKDNNQYVYIDNKNSDFFLSNNFSK